MMHVPKPMPLDTHQVGLANDPAPRVGHVALVGAGPGAKDLITLRGAKRLQEADVILYDRLIDPEVLDFARNDAARIYVGKKPGDHCITQDQICDLLVTTAQQGKHVVRLKCGDPGIFARGAEEADALSCAGIPYEIVPGVTSASAAAAATGGFLTERGKIDTLVLTTGQTETATQLPDWMHTLRPGTKTAIYMGVSNAHQIAAQIGRSPWHDRIIVEIVSDAQKPEQKVMRCTPNTLIKTLDHNAIKGCAIIFLSIPKKAQQEHEPLMERTTEAKLNHTWHVA